MRTPAELYRPSERKLPALVIPAYPKDWYPHTVDSTGKIIHRRWSVYLSKVLSRYVVAVEERATECRVWFCNFSWAAMCTGWTRRRHQCHKR